MQLIRGTCGAPCCAKWYIRNKCLEATSIQSRGKEHFSLERVMNHCKKIQWKKLPTLDNFQALSYTFLKDLI